MAYLDTQWYGFAVKYLNHFYTASLAISLIINFLIFSTSVRRVAENHTYSEYSSLYFFEQTYLAIELLGIVQIILSIMLLILWIIINGPLILRQQWRIKTSKNANKNIQHIEDHKQLQELTLKELREQFHHKGPYHQVFKDD